MLGQVESLRSPAPANTEDPDQSSLIRAFFVCHCVCIFLAIHVSVHVKNALFDYSNAGVRILRNSMNESWGKLKLLGDKLRLSSGCPSDKFVSLDYF